jgi:cytochrome-b5 reductase
MDLSTFKSVPFWVGIGTLAVTALAALYFHRNKSKPRTLKDSSVKYPLKLVEKINLSHDTRLFRFELPSKNHILGLPTGQHIHLSANVNGQLVVRPYTPVSSDDDLGHMDLVIKVYFKDVHPKFPDGGKMTQYVNDLAIGQTIDVRGPSGKLIYNGCGEFAIRPDKKAPSNNLRVKKINMIAGGSGITPMLQIIKAVFKDKNDTCSLSLVYANQTEEDILCRSDLEDVLRENPGRFKLWYTLDRPPANWKYSSGFINDEMLKNNFFPPSDDTLVLMCGPPPMINFACTPALDKLGYDSKLRFAY